MVRRGLGVARLRAYRPVGRAMRRGVGPIDGKAASANWSGWSGTPNRKLMRANVIIEGAVYEMDNDVPIIGWQMRLKPLLRSAKLFSKVANERSKMPREGELR
jgi:hypothetical protein